jgi:oxygen-dependent protoporphyrinogen oxidase
MNRLFVIGGGITGLAAAHRLVELSTSSAVPTNLTLLESSPRVGGIIATARHEGFLIEAGPDSFITHKPAGIELCRRLGLTGQLIQTNGAFRRTFIVRAGKLVPAPDGFQLLAPTNWKAFIKSPLFTWRGKARMALDLLIPRGRGAGDESLGSFVRRRFGREALERAAQPLVSGIYTADPERLSLAATMPRFLEMEQRHRSIIRALRREAAAANSGGAGAAGVRYSLFVSFREGMQSLADALVARLPRGAVRCNLAVRAVRLGARGRWSIEIDDGQQLEAGAVILAAPAFAIAQMLEGLDAELSRELAAIDYASAATINLVYERDAIGHPLDGFGFVVPATERMTTLACTFSSVKFAGRAPEGKVLLRAFVGGAMNPESLELDDEGMVACVRGELQRLLDIRRAPWRAIVSRWPRSMPQYPVGHLEHVARIRARLAHHHGLFLAGNAYGGVGIPDCISSGEAAAEAALAWLTMRGMRSREAGKHAGT